MTTAPRADTNRMSKRERTIPAHLATAQRIRRATTMRPENHDPLTAPLATTHRPHADLPGLPQPQPTEATSSPASELTYGARRQVVAKRLATSLLVVASSIVILSLLGGFPTSWQVPAMTAFDLFCILCAAPIGLFLNRPRRKWPWIIFFLAGVGFSVEYQLRQTFHTFGDLGPNRSLMPDLVAIPAYAMVLIGLIGLIGSSKNHPPLGLASTLDGLIAGLGALTVAWAFVIGPVLYRTSSPIGIRLLESTYPVIDVCLLAIAFRLDFAPISRRTLATTYILCAVLALMVGDVLYTMGELHDITVPFSVLDSPYVLTATFFGVAALHPSMRALSDGYVIDDNRRRAAVRVRLMVVAFGLLLPAMLVVWNRNLTGSDRIVVAVLLALTVATASIRLLTALSHSAQTELRLEYEASHDSLTGLPNRRYAERHITHLFDSDPLPGEEPQIALIFLDLDRFKLVNDTFGHTTGDLLLIAVARRLRHEIREGDLLARIGGDEFVIVVPTVQHVESLRRYAQRIRRCFDSPFSIHENEFFMTASIGVSTARRDDPMADSEKIIRDADTAMYQAKEKGRDAVELFDVSMRDKVTSRLELEHDLRLALERDQFFLGYQPIIRLGSGDAAQVVGLEALLRWDHPHRGLIGPDHFIGIAEETGTIIEIGKWVIVEACRQFAEWQLRHPEFFRNAFVSVNLSSGQLTWPYLVAMIGDTLRHYELPAPTLCLELTESLLMSNPAKGVELLEGMRAAGLRLAIDDFGTGYSSLAYLRQFSVDYVKIDQSFVSGLMKGTTPNETLVAAIVAMAAAFRSETIAEGVEYEVQAQRLRKLGCTLVQGHHYACPLPPALVPSIVEELTKRPRLSLLPER